MNAIMEMQVAPRCANTLRPESDWIGVEPMDDRTCSIEGCPGKHSARGWCQNHYMQWRRTGDPLTVKPHSPPRNFGCLVVDCDRKHRTKGYCSKHYLQFLLHGDPLYNGRERRGEESPLWRGDEVGYQAIHRRLKMERGRAADYECVDCGAKADDWSYRGDSPHERRSVQRDSGIAYSTRIEDYSPRCRKCHKGYDNAMREAG